MAKKPVWQDLCFVRRNMVNNNAQVGCWVELLNYWTMKFETRKTFCGGFFNCFNLLVFWWACVTCSQTSLFLPDRSSSQCGLLPLSPICLKIWGVQRCSSAHSKAVLDIVLWPLTTKRYFYQDSSLDVFSFPQTIPCKPQRWWCGKIPVDHAMLCSKSRKSPFFLILMLGLLFNMSSQPTLNFWPIIGWLDICIHMYLTK